jgi:hypothetical protein
MFADKPALDCLQTMNWLEDIRLMPALERVRWCASDLELMFAELAQLCWHSLWEIISRVQLLRFGIIGIAIVAAMASRPSHCHLIDWHG